MADQEPFPEPPADRNAPRWPDRHAIPDERFDGDDDGDLEQVLQVMQVRRLDAGG
jgi:hypothetical protein